ncbi:helix-turn-helix transcriptional regulator [Paenibacillus thalictri]|uniref:AraC family transcriptional regulator n=1 Tax=Paenibacillus thalictri TaxID=2527873 RepID=A0A4V2J4W8_9BACL|nr:AraC family transcriptional regulator [Paenibacillus thalictri]TBL81502.1 AraC family transcriptional regulator [Paenibacillus thalictri]
MFRFVSPPMPHFIVCGEDTYTAGRKHPDRSNIGVFDLLVVTRGCLHLEENGMPLPVPAGHYAVIRPDLSHKTEKGCEEETHFYWLHFQTLGTWSAEPDLLPFVAAGLESPYAQIETFAFELNRTGHLQHKEIVYEAFTEMIRLQADGGTPTKWECQQLFLTLLRKIQEESSAAQSSPQLVLANRVIAFLRSHYAEPLSYTRLAEQLHFHENYISLCMKNIYGCTPLEYLTRHRIEQAKHLLIHTNEPVSLIAESTGFGSFPYFIRCFTRHTDCTPKQFRMRYRK